MSGGHVFLPGKSHAQRNLLGYSPLSHKELDTTEHRDHTTSKQHCLQEQSQVRAGFLELE